MTSWAYNIRIRRCRLYPRRHHREAFRGYVASKRRYFYGLHCLPLDFAPGATLLADAGYTDYGWEDGLLDEAGIRLVSLRRGNSKRPLPPWLTFICQRCARRLKRSSAASRRL